MPDHSRAACQAAVLQHTWAPVYSMQQPANPLSVTHDGWLIESELPFQGLDGRRGGIRTEHDLRGIAGQDFQRGKDHHGCHQQGDSQAGKSFEQEQSHEGVSVWGGGNRDKSGRLG